MSVKVIIKDKTKLELLEDAKKGDIIDLLEIEKLDSRYINQLIDNEKEIQLKARFDSIKNEAKLVNEKEITKLISKYDLEKQELSNQLNTLASQSKLERDKALLEKDSVYKLQIQELQNNLKELQTTMRNNKDKEINDLVKKYDLEKQDLNNKLKSLEEKFELEKTNALAEKEIAYKLEIQKLQNELTSSETKISSIKDKEILEKTKELEIKLLNDKNNFERILSEKEKQHELEIVKTNLHFEKQLGELNNKVLEIEIDKEKEISLKQQEIDKLELKKNSLNIKQLGEDLENWCDQEYNSYSLVGFQNCTWEKDNEVVRNDDESKGTKADYIFKSYLSNEYKDEHILTSVCCEMKNESLVSVNKKKNSDHYAKLDKDRIKKKCEYALLISELEWTNDNDAPIRKVNEYDKMYVVRPQYFVTFLSIVVSLANKFKDILNERNKEELLLKDSKDIIEEFEKFKTTYLDNPLKKMLSGVEEIQKQSMNINKANNIITEKATELINKTISDIQLKIERFDIKKVSNRVKKIETEVGMLD